MSLIGSSSAHKLFLMLLPLFFVHQTSSSPISCRAWNNTHELYEDLKYLGTFLNQLCSSNSDGSNPDCRDLRLNKTSQEASSSPDYFIKGLEQLMGRVPGTSTDINKIIEPLTDSCKCPDVNQYICSKTFLLPSVISPVAFYEVLNTRVQQYSSKSMQTPSSTD